MFAHSPPFHALPLPVPIACPILGIASGLATAAIARGPALALEIATEEAADSGHAAPMSSARLGALLVDSLLPPNKPGNPVAAVPETEEARGFRRQDGLVS